MLAAPSSSMSPSSPVGTPDTSLELQDDAPKNRRVSGRVRSKPVSYSDPPEPTATTNGVKRKRAPTVVDTLSEDDIMAEGESTPPVESDPDEEELKEKRRKARNTPKKPAAKKSKTTTLAMRPATNGVKRTARPKRAKGIASIVANEEEGLFGMSSCLTLYTMTDMLS